MLPLLALLAPLSSLVLLDLQEIRKTLMTHNFKSRDASASKNNTCAELFGLVLPHRTYLLNHLICKDDNVEHLVLFDIA